MPIESGQTLLHYTLLDKIGGLAALGSPKTDNIYHAGWAWAGGAPYQYTKLIASHFGGTRNPLVVSWPDGIRRKGGLRSQFYVQAAAHQHTGELANDPVLVPRRHLEVL